MKNLDILTIEDLRLIIAIADQGSLTAGAAQLRMSQSNASYSLKKIQTALQTELFVRKGRKLVPSEYGWYVYTHTNNALAEFQAVLNPPVFDPTEEFTLVFGATEYDLAVIFPHVQRLLKEYAAKAMIKVVALDTTNTLGQLADLDFIFAPMNLASASVQTLELLTDSRMVFYDKTKQEAPQTLAKYIAAPHAIASFDGTTITSIDRLLAKKGMKRRVMVSAFGFAAVAALIRDTDIITTMPKLLENTLFAGFAQCPLPFADDPMTLYMCWEAAKDERGKIRWFINLMRQNPIQG